MIKTGRHRFWLLAALVLVLCGCANQAGEVQEVSTRDAAAPRQEEAADEEISGHSASDAPGTVPADSEKEAQTKEQVESHTPERAGGCAKPGGQYDT